MKVSPILSEAMVSWMARIIFYGFKSIGLAPVSLDTKTRARNSRNVSVKPFSISKTGQLYNLVFVILLLYAGVLITTSATTMEYPNKSRMTDILDLIQHILYVSTSSFIVVYLTLRQKKVVTIMNRLSDVRFLLSSVKEQFASKLTYIFLWLKIAYTVFTWTAHILSDYAYNSYLPWFVTDFTELIIYSFFMEYSIILGILARELEIVNQKLSSLKDFQNSLLRTSLSDDRSAILSLSTHDQLATLKFLHSLRTALFDVSRDIADLFSLPILFSIATFFFVFIYDCYFLAIPFVVPIEGISSTIYHIDLGVWFGIIVYPLTILSFNVAETTKKAKLTGQIVHKLLAAARKQEIQAELEQFSLQLIHEDVSFTAYGFFSLDFTLMQSIFGAAVTYLVIIMQYVQSQEDANRNNTSNATIAT